MSVGIFDPLGMSKIKKKRKIQNENWWQRDRRARGNSLWSNVVK